MATLSLKGLGSLFKPISLKSLIKTFIKRPLLGIDIGHSAIKIVRLGEGLELLNFYSYDLPAALVETTESEIREGNILGILGTLLSELNIKQKEVAICLPSRSVIIKKIELAKTQKKDIPKAISEKAEEYIPYSLNKVNIGYQMISEGSNESDKMEIMLVAAKKEEVRHQIEMFREIGLTPYVIDVDSFALANAYKICYGSSAEPIAIINIGARKINIVIVTNAIPLLTRELGTGGIYLTEQVKSNLNVAYEEAERIKIEGIADESFLDVLKEVYRLVAQEWLQEIRSVLGFFESTTNMKIAKIFLCGGASRMPGFSNFLERSLRLEIQPPNIFSKVRYSKHDFDPKYLDYYNPQAVTAFGLALRLMGE